MRYTINQFREQYPNDDVCLDKVFQNRFSSLKHCPKCAAETKFYRVKKRQCYACKWCGYQLFPLSNTIFRSSTTPLVDWFYAIYLFSVSKNGVSASELQRHLGVTYKTAWRMCKQIRILMKDDNNILGELGNPVEIDEFEYGHKGKGKNLLAFMAVERNGKAKIKVTDWASKNRAMSFVRANIETGVKLYSDGSHIYQWSDKEYQHDKVIHSKRQWTKGEVYTNTVEGLWGYIESSIMGTYRGISPKYFQSYLDEFIYRYNNREAIFASLLESVGKP